MQTFTKHFSSSVVLIFFSYLSMGQFSGAGSGTDIDPYIVTTPTELDEIRDDLTAYYELGNDIDLTFATSDPSGDFYNSGAGWEPIGAVSETESFSGSLDGSGFTLTGLTINRPSEDNIGLFAALTTGASISNLHLEDVSITGQNQVGALSGTRFVFLGSDGYEISRISVSGEVSGSTNVGGLFGSAGDANGTVTTTISEVYSNAVVTGTSNLGGLIGSGSSLILSNSYSIGMIVGPGTGLIGSLGSALGNEINRIENCYSAGKIDGTSPDAVSGGSDIDNEITNTYFDMETSEVFNSNGGTRRSHAMMQQQSLFNGWDFSTIWSIDEGTSYPYLQNNTQTPSPILTPDPEVLPFAGGIGSGDFPWEIETVTQFNSIRLFPEDTFLLKNNLDFSIATGDPGGAYYNGGLGWEPIESFEGKLDGGGFTIDGLFINRPTEVEVGLFATGFGATISDIILTNVEVTGQSTVGALVGYVRTNNDAIGADISNVGVEGTVTAEDGVCGGIVGHCRDSDIIRSYVEGTVTGPSDGPGIGGIAGYLIGDLSVGMQNSYAIADVSGGESTGGLAGLTNSSKITNCYHSGSITRTGTNFSGLYGGVSNFTVASNSYWNSEISCILGSNSSTELVTQSTFNGWDFTNTWAISEGNQKSPHLQWRGDGEYHDFMIFSAFLTPELPDRSATCEFIYDSQPSINDGCGKEIFGTPKDSEGNHPFPITEVGTTVVTWTFEDDFGNTVMADQNFILNPDEEGPVPDATDLPDLTDECSVTVGTAPTATDACWGGTSGVADVEFPITAQGTTVITWTYSDGEGNTTTQMQNVIINDVTDPVPDLGTLEDFTGECEIVSLTPPTATDNCLGTIQGTTETPFPITDLGSTVITWTYTDENGNSVSQDQTIIIQDTQVPVADIPALPLVFSDCEGMVTQIAPPTATDNCAGTITATTNQVFPFQAVLDTTQIVWEYDDGNGNSQIQFQKVVLATEVSVSVDTSVCEDATFAFPDGTVWSGESSHVSTLTTQNGCDSIITTTVTVHSVAEIDLGEEVLGCLGEQLAFGIDEANIDFETYTISTLFGNSATDDSLKFIFDETFAATASTQDVFVTIELTYSNGCTASDEVLVRDNTIKNWAIIVDPTNDPQIQTDNTVFPESTDSFEWDFGDGTTNATEEHPSHTYTENGNYIVTLTVANECGQESLSSEIPISGVMGLGFSDWQKQTGVQIFPNPTVQFLTINKGTNQSIHIEILDATGRSLIKQRTKDQLTKVDLTPISRGVYFVVLSHGDERLVNRIIKK